MLHELIKPFGALTMSVWELKGRPYRSLICFEGFNLRRVDGLHRLNAFDISEDIATV